MGLFSQYYKIENENINHIVFAEQVGDNIEFTYFQGESELDRVTIESTGEARLRANDSEIKISQTWLGTKLFLITPNGEIQLVKVKKSEIFQDVSKANEKPPIQINYKIIVSGILLALISLLLYYYYPDSSSLVMKVFPFGVAFLGGHLIASQLFQNENILGKSKSRILVSLIFGIGTLIFAENYFGNSSDISGNSPLTKAIISKVDFHEAMRIKRKDIDAYWSHDYIFYVDGKEYSGYKRSSNPIYKIGDTIMVQYLEGKPQFNKQFDDTNPEDSDD